MEKMTHAEIHAFLTEGALTASVATVRDDGRPHVVPIWYMMDGETLVFMSWHESVKVQNLRRDNRVTLCIEDGQPPFNFVMFEGTAEITDPPAEEREKWAGTIAGRYMGEDRAEEFGKRNGVEGELTIRVTPTNIVAFKDMAD